MKALKIKFDPTKKGSPYTPEFVEIVLESREQAKSGKIKQVKREDLKTYLDL